MANIQKGQTVLVTGASGYIGSHIAEELVAAGYKVRGTSRRSVDAQWLVDYIDRKFGVGMIEIVEVPDMIQEDAYDAAVVGVSGIIHLASVMTFSTDLEEVVGPSVQGTLNMFRSAKREPRVKSLVYTSSSTACALPLPDQEITMTKDTFNETAIAAAYKAHPTPFDVYAASKAASEKAFSTGSWITDFHSGKDYPFSDGQRIFAFAHAYNWNDILAIFRKLQPGKSFLEDRAQERVLVDVPNDEAEDLLKKHYGHGWTSLEESIRQNLSPIMA